MFTFSPSKYVPQPMLSEIDEEILKINNRSFSQTKRRSGRQSPTTPLTNEKKNKKEAEMVNSLTGSTNATNANLDQN